MGSVFSPVKAIDGLYCEESLSRATKVESAVCVNGMIVIKIDAGRYWCSWKPVREGALVPGHWGSHMTNLMRGLQKLGMISKADVEAHLAYEKRATEQREIKSDREQLEYLAKKHGFKAPQIGSKS